MLALHFLPPSLLQAGAIFLSIMIEALPFVLIGAVLSGFIEVFINPDQIPRILPKNKLAAILLGTLAGFVFPSCECGIVPIVHRLLEKKIPSYTAIPFLITAPVLNPIVLFATFTAFGNSLLFVFYRALGAVLVAGVLGIFLAFFHKESILQVATHSAPVRPLYHQPTLQKIGHALIHAIDEFFDTGRYLILGCLFASLVQVYIPTAILTSIATSPLLAILLMMFLSFLLSLCSEADAFIGASLLSSFGFAPVMAFLVIGPMLDIKNVLMMQHYFTPLFILKFITLIIVTVLTYSLMIGGFV